jgi:hypothetical protein
MQSGEALVRRFDRHIGTAPDRDPDAGPRERRRIVDPVSEHGNDFPRRCNSTILIDLAGLHPTARLLSTPRQEYDRIINKVAIRTRRANDPAGARGPEQILASEQSM